MTDAAELADCRTLDEIAEWLMLELDTEIVSCPGVIPYDEAKPVILRAIEAARSLSPPATRFEEAPIGFGMWATQEKGEYRNLAMPGRLPTPEWCFAPNVSAHEQESAFEGAKRLAREELSLLHKVAAKRAVSNDDADKEQEKEDGQRDGGANFGADALGSARPGGNSVPDNLLAGNLAAPLVRIEAERLVRRYAHLAGSRTMRESMPPGAIDVEFLNAASAIEKLAAMKTPASRQLLNITKGCLESAEADLEAAQATIARLEKEKAELFEKCSVGMSLGCGHMVYGSIEAIGHAQNLLLIDSQHPIEKEDVRHSLLRQLTAVQAQVARLREALEKVQAHARNALPVDEPIRGNLATGEYNTVVEIFDIVCAALSEGTDATPDEEQKG